jgi:hypothetical protein
MYHTYAKKYNLQFLLHLGSDGTRMSLRSSTRSLMTVLMTNTVCAHRAFSVCAPVLWNSRTFNYVTVKNLLNKNWIHFYFIMPLTVNPVAKRFWIFGLCVWRYKNDCTYTYLVTYWYIRPKVRVNGVLVLVVLKGPCKGHTQTDFTNVQCKDMLPSDITCIYNMPVLCYSYCSLKYILSKAAPTPRDLDSVTRNDVVQPPFIVTSRLYGSHFLRYR